MLELLLNILFPQYCADCGKFGDFLCPVCEQKLEVKPTVVREKTISLFDYKNKAVRKLLWQLKYKGNKKIAEFFAPFLADALLETEVEEKSLDIRQKDSRSILVPVPIFKTRKNRRGFNQSEILTQKLANMYPDFFVCQKDLVRKTKNTKPQVSCKNKMERLSNVIDSFSAKIPEEFLNRKFIIIDDITTTGATINEITKVLQKAGVKNISAITLAH